MGARRYGSACWLGRAATRGNVTFVRPEPPIRTPSVPASILSMNELRDFSAFLHELPP